MDGNFYCGSNLSLVVRLDDIPGWKRDLRLFHEFGIGKRREVDDWDVVFLSDYSGSLDTRKLPGEVDIHQDKVR